MDQNNAAKQFLAPRLKALRQEMDRRRLDGYLLTHPGDLAYLTGFTGDDSIGLVTQQGVTLLTDFRYQEQAQREAPDIKALMREGAISQLVAKQLIEQGLERVGFEANFTHVGLHNAINRSLATEAGMTPASCTLVAVDDLMVKQRQVKDAQEVAIIRKAIEIAQEAWLSAKSQLRLGMTENELAALLVYEMRKRGATGASFDSIVGARTNGSLPHYRPAEVPIEKDFPLLVDWGARYQGYCSDLTRTYVIGNANPKMGEIYKIVLEAQLAGIAAIKPGVSTQKVDAAARDLIGRAGYAEFFGHGLGHGIGRDIHELPVLRKLGPGEELRPGMIVTVEPGIYLPGVGGVRIEDDVLVTETGHEVLSNLDKSWEGARVAL